MARRAFVLRLALAACLALPATNCARTAPFTVHAAGSTCAPARAPLVDRALDGAPESPRGPWLEIDRHGCYGACPAYRVEVDALGALRFQGRMYTKARGEHRRRLGADERAEVERVLARLHCLPDFDRKEATDHARVIITYTLGGQNFRYVHEGSDSSAPPEARHLELALESALGIESWAASDPSWDRDLAAEFDESERRERERARALEAGPRYKEAEDGHDSGD